MIELKDPNLLAVHAVVLDSLWFFFVELTDAHNSMNELARLSFI